MKCKFMFMVLAIFALAFAGCDDIRDPSSFCQPSGDLGCVLTACQQDPRTGTTCAGGGIYICLPNETAPTCNTDVGGAAGASGESGSSGSSGASGSSNGSAGSTDGASGSNGASGASGSAGSTNGTAGSSNGANGSAGSNGASGTNGSSGNNGASGSAGASGSTNGSNGSAGSTDGASGSSGTSGSSGSAGSTNGTAGSTNGANGSAGSNGASGTSGASGSSGSSGSNGTSGASGSAGSTNGANGASGTAGVSGSAGSNGTAGASGNSGSSGSAGSSGGHGGAQCTPVFDQNVLVQSNVALFVYRKGEAGVHSGVYNATLHPGDILVFYVLGGGGLNISTNAGVLNVWQAYSPDSQPLAVLRQLYCSQIGNPSNCSLDISQLDDPPFMSSVSADFDCWQNSICPASIDSVLVIDLFDLLGVVDNSHPLSVNIQSGREFGVLEVPPLCPQN